MEEVAEAAKMEQLQLSFMPSVEGTGFAAGQESGEHNCMVDFNLRGKCDSSPLPEFLSLPKALLALEMRLY